MSPRRKAGTVTPFSSGQSVLCSPVVEELSRNTGLFCVFRTKWGGLSLRFRLDGGEGGIRTPDTLSGMPVFKTGAINHSATSPELLPFYYTVAGSAGLSISIRNTRRGGGALPPRAVDYFATTRLLVTEKIPGTPRARIPAMFLSASLSTTPSRVTFPFFTTIRIGLRTGKAYRCSGG
jgi:hypothetical protein